MQEREPRTVTRRVVSRTAWTVPALAVLPTARAAAASCGSLPSVAFQGSWSNAQGTNWSNVGIYGFRQDVREFGANAEPAISASGGTAVVSTSITLNLEPNRNYQLSVPVKNWTRTNPLAATATITGGGTTTTRNTDQANPGTLVHSFLTGASGTVTLTVSVSLPRPASSPPYGDDIWLGSPTLRCV